MNQKLVSHYHITLSEIDSDLLKSTANIIKAKPTTIDLVGATHELRDRMLTKYQKGIGLSQMKTDVETIKNHGFTVKRFKLEQMIPDLEENTILDYGLDINEDQYIEVHVKVKFTKNMIEVDGFQHSRNPSEETHFFYNARARSIEEVKKVREGIQKLHESHIDVKSIHYEYTVYDSNSEHDAWWL